MTVTLSRTGYGNSGANGLHIIGNTAAAASPTTDTETIGTLAIDAGQSVVGVVQGTANRATVLNAANGLTRVNNGTLLIRGSNLGGAATAVGEVTLGSLTSLVQVGTSTSSTGAAGTTKDLTIVPYIVGDTNASGIGSATTASFVTYDTGGRGFRVLSTDEQNLLTLTTDTFTNTNVRYDAAGTLTLDSGNRIWNSLVDRPRRSQWKPLAPGQRRHAEYHQRRSANRRSNDR